MKTPPIVNTRPVVGRNVACPFCGSGRKFKRCCGAPKPLDLPEGVQLAARAAGRPHEKPILFAFDKRVAVGPIPCSR